jgi:Probable zinc-ribbon domain
MVCADRHLTCVDCGQEFVFTGDEHVFFQKRQFQFGTRRVVNRAEHCAGPKVLPSRPDISGSEEESLCLQLISIFGGSLKWDFQFGAGVRCGTYA